MGGLQRMASDLGFSVRDQVYRRIRQGEVRQLQGVRRKALALALQNGHLLASVPRLPLRLAGYATR